MPSIIGSLPSPVAITQVAITPCPRPLAIPPSPAAHPVPSSVKRTQNQVGGYYSTELIILFEAMDEILSIGTN